MKKRDAADHLREEGPERFRDRLDEEIGKQRGKPNSNGKWKPSRFKLKCFSDVKTCNEPNYRVKGILPHSGLAVVWGAPKCGKSFWVFDLVMHVALGREYRGRRVQQGAVVYLALEGGAGFANRIEAWRRRCLNGHGSKPVPLFLIDVALDLVAEHSELIAAIHEQLQGTNPAVVVIDTLNRSLAGSENKDEDMASYIRAADVIRQTFNCLVLIIHHCGTAGNRPRGHTSLAGADDAQISIVRDKDGFIVCTVEHAKDFEAGAVIACKLERVELGTDRDGDQISSCIIVPAEASEAGPKLSKVQRFALAVLQRLIKSDGVKPPPDLHEPPPKVCLVDTWRKEFYATYPAEKHDTKKKALFRATLDLEGAGLIALSREFVWVRERDK
jgi:AAA domain